MSSFSANTPSEVSVTNATEVPATNATEVLVTNNPSEIPVTNATEANQAEDNQAEASERKPRLTSVEASDKIGKPVHVGNGECCICFQVFDAALISPYAFGQCSHCVCLKCIEQMNTGNMLCPICRTGVTTIIAMGGDERTISQTLNALQPSARSPAIEESPPPMRSVARDESPPPTRSPTRVNTVPQNYQPFAGARSTSPGIAEPRATKATPVSNKATPVSNKAIPASPVKPKPPKSNGPFLPSTPHRSIRKLSSDAIRFRINYAMSKNPGDLGIVLGNLEKIQAGNRALDVAFLLDVSGSMRDEINNMKNSLTKFVRDCNGKAARISITIFSTYVQNIVGFTLVTDATIGGIIAQIESQLRAIDFTNLCGGITYIQKLLDSSAREHPLAQLTTLVILTDGKPNGSIFNCKASFSALMKRYPNLTTSIIALGGNVSLSNLEAIRGHYRDQVVLKSARTGLHIDAALNAVLEVPPSIEAAISIRFECGAVPVNREYTEYNNVGSDATSQIVNVSAMPINAGILIPFRSGEGEPHISYTAMIMGEPFSGLVCADETISEEFRTFYPEEQNARAEMDKVLNQFSTNPAIRKQKLEELKRMIESSGEPAFGSYYAPLIASIELHITSATIASNPRVSASEKTIAENEAFADRACSGRSYSCPFREISDLTDVDFMGEDIDLADVDLADMALADMALADVALADVASGDAALANVALADALADGTLVDVALADALADGTLVDVALADGNPVDIALENIAPEAVNVAPVDAALDMV
jgi:uncharacterized protein YegL